MLIFHKLPQKKQTTDNRVDYESAPLTWFIVVWSPCGCEINIDSASTVSDQSQNYQVCSKSPEDTLVCALKHYIGQNAKCQTSVSKLWCPTIMPYLRDPFAISKQRHFRYLDRGSRFLNFRLIRLDSFVFPSCLNSFSKITPFVFSSYLL